MQRTSALAALAAFAALAALAAGEANPRTETLPVISSERALADALARSPALLLFFYRRLDARAPAGRPQQGVEGGLATVQLATAMATLASGPFAGLIAAVDCARTPAICAEHAVGATPAFALWRRGRLERYAGALDAAAVAAYLERELVAMAASESIDTGPTTVAGRVRAGLAGLGALAWASAALASSASGVRAKLLLGGGAAGALLCGLASLYVCGVRPERRRAARAARQLRGAPVALAGGRAGWLVGGSDDGARALPALVLLGPRAPVEVGAQREQRAALQRVATRLAARGFRCLLLDARADAAAAPAVDARAAANTPAARGGGKSGGGKGKAAGKAAGKLQAAEAAPACAHLTEADVASASEWLRANAAPAAPAAVADAARVGLVGIGEGGALVARMARRESYAALFSCAVALDVCADGADGAGCLSHVRALVEGARVPAQVHLDLAEAGLGAERAERVALAERLRAVLPPAVDVGARAPCGACVRLFLYGEHHADDTRVADADAPAAPLALLLQPDGRREVAKGYAWMRLVAFLQVHLAHD